MAPYENDDKERDIHLERRPTITGLVVDNPLQRCTPEQVVVDAERFCRDHNLEDHHELFGKAALVARDPDNFQAVDLLSDEERNALEFEKDHKWSGTFTLYFCMVLCALGAATQGWDQTGSNGANLSFPQEFGIASTLEQPGGQRDEWIVGFINSAPYLSAALVGCWLSDPLNHWFGRRGEIFITAIVLIAIPIASGFSRNWQQLLVIRLIWAWAWAQRPRLSPYMPQSYPPHVFVLWVCFGIFLGFAANVVVKDVPRIAWRLQLGSAFIPAFPLALFIFCIPESPRWLMKKGRYPEAFCSFLKIRKHPIIAARDLYYSHVLYLEEIAAAQGSSYLSRLADCFRVPRIRRATIGASVVMIAQQMCGINIISFYSSTVFKEGGYNDDQALFASLGFGALNFAFAIPAVFTIDTFGRRSLLLSTFPFMCIFLLATGLAFLMPDSQMQTRTSLIAAFIYIYTAFYSVGEGPVAFLYSAEVFPTVQREQGMAWAVAVNNFFASALGLTFPRMKRAMKPVGAFGFYAFLTALAFVWIFLFVPETKALTLEELDQVFSVPTNKFIKYQWRVWVPYVFKRYVLRKKIAPPAPLTVHSEEDVSRSVV